MNEKIKNKIAEVEALEKEAITAASRGDWQTAQEVMNKLHLGRVEVIYDILVAKIQ